MRESSLFPEFVLEGEQIRARKDVLQAITLRFGEDKASEFREALERIDELNRLDELHKLAIKGRLSQFRKAMTAG